MLVTKKKAKFLTVINLNYIWIFIFLSLAPFVGSILSFSFNFFDADFNMEEAWELAEIRPERAQSNVFRGQGFVHMLSRMQIFIILLSLIHI